MGEPLYEQVVGPLADGKLGRPCRIYAPVGTHETLLAYLVRRLLENGANTSFVNRIADASVPIDELVEDPVTTVERIAAAEAGAAPRVVGRPHPAIPLPREIYGGARLNSRGLDLSNEDELALLAEALRASRSHAWTAAPMLAASDAASTDRGEGGGDGEGDGHDLAAARRATAPRSRFAIRPTTTTSSATFARRRSPTSSAPSASAREGAAAWAATAAGDARRHARARRRFARGRPAAPARPARPRGGQDLSERHRRSARGGRLPPLLRGPGAARPRRRRRRFRSARSSASARGISRSRSSPARSPPRSPPATRCSPSPPSRRR